MGYAAYVKDGRWGGYYVPAECDYPECSSRIHRGLDYRCDIWYEFKYYENGVEVSEEDDWDEEVEIEHETGCEFFFCREHEDHIEHSKVEIIPKPDLQEWLDEVELSNQDN